MRTLDRGIEAVARGEFGTALRLFTEVINSDGQQRGLAYRHRGHTYGIMRDWHSAIKDLTIAIELGCQSPNPYVNRACAFVQICDYSRAISDCIEAMRIEPKLPSAYACLARCYLAMHNLDRAIIEFTRAIDLGQDESPQFISEILMGRGSALSECSQYDNAIADFTEAIRLVPANALAFYNRGISHAERDELALAISDFTEAIKLGHHDALRCVSERYSWRGYVFLKMADYDFAIADFSEAVRIDPTNGFAFYYRGISYQRQGDTRNAQDDLSRASALESKNS